MKLHTQLNRNQVIMALNRAKYLNLVSPTVEFAQITPEKSSTHPNGFMIQLGSASGDKSSLLPNATNQYGKPQKRRLTRNGSVRYDPLRFSATWYEWGWFMMEIFKADPTARWGGLGKSSFGYHDLEDFHGKTNYKFM